MYFYQITEDNPVTMKMVKFMYACDGLLEIVNVLDKYCDEDEYLEILYDNIQKWINESQEVLSQYFINFKKSIGKIEIAVTALDDFFDSHDFDDCWIDRDVKVGSEHEGDIFCGFDLDIDKEWFKKMLEDDGFVLEDDEDGFWITGVKE